MKKCKVLTFFTDLQDNDYKYHAGDLFPRDGLNVSEDRIKELSTKKNLRGIPLIEKIEEPAKESVEEPVEESKPEPTRKRGRKKE